MNTFRTHFPVASRTGQDIISDLDDSAHPGAKDVGNTLFFQVRHRFSADHPPIRNNADLTDVEAAPQPFDHRNTGFYVSGVSRPHLAADRLAVVVNDHAHYHLVAVGAVILAVPFLPQGLASRPFKVDGGGVKEDDIETGKEIAALPKEVFLNDIFRAPSHKGRLILLIRKLLAEKGHGSI